MSYATYRIGNPFDVIWIENVDEIETFCFYFLSCSASEIRSYRRCAKMKDDNHYDDADDDDDVNIE